MHSQLVPLICTLGLAISFGACKREETRSTDLLQNSGSDSAASGSVSSQAQDLDFSGNWKLDFTDATPRSGVDAIYRNGEESDNFSIVESLGGGVGSFDFDLDGNADLIFPGGGTIEADKPLTGFPTSLYRAIGSLQYRNVADSAGIANSQLYTHGVAIADVDADGFPDAVVTGYGAIQLFLNNGDGTFTEKSAGSGVNSQAWSSSAAFADLDNDGIVDLYVANYVNWSWQNNPKCLGGSPTGNDVCTPQVFEGLSDIVFWNRGNGTFEKASESNGLVASGKGLGALACDFNHDSLPEVYVANDTTNNFLYINEGQRKLRESGVISGTALDHLGIPNGSMGLAVFDYDNDLLPDLLVANYERESFAVYRNEGNGNFRCISERTGITALGSLYVGFGTTSGDFNCNGSEELVVSNGHLMRYPQNDNLKQFPLFLINDSSRKLKPLRFDSSSYFSQRHIGRGVIAVDLDGDQMLDLVFSHSNHPASILKNTSPVAGRSIMLRLIGTRSNRDAIGARAVLQTSGGKYLRQIFGGGSYLSQGPYEMHWGIPENDSPVSLEIVWPDATRQVLTDLVAGEHYTVVQE